MKGPVKRTDVRQRWDGRKTAVGYLRVSTIDQGASGLGMAAQRATVESFCRNNGYELVGTYSDVESGGRPLAFRIGLHDAIERAEATRSLLVIARLDRLSRSASFIATLLDTKVAFVACDIPSATRVVLHILAAIAEEESRATSIRTKAAMAAAKARGAVFGQRSFPPGAQARGSAMGAIALRMRSLRSFRIVEPRIRELRAEGFSYRTIARVLNNEDYTTSAGGRWFPMGVWVAAKRLGVK